MSDGDHSSTFDPSKLTPAFALQWGLRLKADEAAATAYFGLFTEQQKAAFGVGRFRLVLEAFGIQRRFAELLLAYSQGAVPLESVSPCIEGFFSLYKSVAALRAGIGDTVALAPDQWANGVRGMERLH